MGTEGTLQGVLLVLTGLVIILIALSLITSNMRSLVADRVERSVNAILGKGGGAIAILLGMVITIAVQSSSITTSILIPMAGAGVLSLRNIYPVTLGANVGTTITALLAALAASDPDALTVALAHTTFNIAGIFLLFVIPVARQLPIRAAEKLADMAVEISKAMLLALRLGRLKDEGRLTTQQVSIGKLNNVREALTIAREARTILGASGISSEYPIMRHMANLESVLTYEGTSEIHTLIIGEALTGLRAYS